MKPLLILDLGQILLFRRFVHGMTPAEQEYVRNLPRHLQPQRIKEHYIWRRNNSNSFLYNCFKRFRVAVWSSAMPHNVHAQVRYLFGERYKELLFVWSQKECEAVPHPDGDKVDKPLFLKNLARVWERFPQYNAGNTILVDNEPRKSRNNPPSCLHVPDPWDIFVNPTDKLSFGAIFHSSSKRKRSKKSSL